MIETEGAGNHFKTQLKQQKAREGQKRGPDGKHAQVDFDDEQIVMTEEQLKAKRLADLRNKHTMNLDVDPFKKKAPPKKPA